MVEGLHMNHNDPGLRCMAADGENVCFGHGDRTGVSKACAAAIKNNDVRLMRCQRFGHFGALNSIASQIDARPGRAGKNETGDSAHLAANISQAVLPACQGEG